MASKIIIDTSSLGITWNQNSNYTLDIEEGFVIEATNNKTPAPAISNAFSFTTNPTGPLITSSTPADNTENVNYTSIQIVFDRHINFNTGSITLGLGEPVGYGTIIKTFDDVSELTINDNVLTLDVRGSIEANTKYYINWTANCLVDDDNFGVAAIVEATDLNFTTGPGPLIASLSPADNATNVVNNTTINVTFDRVVSFGSGTITLKRSNGSTIKTFSDDSEIEFNGAVMSLDVTGYIDAGITYYLIWDEGAIIDNNLFEVAAITQGTTYNFTTAPSTNVNFPDLSANIVSTNSLNYSSFATNIDQTRNFYNNIGNNIFQNNTPEIIGAAPVVKAQVSVSSGELTSDNINFSNSIELAGYKENVNYWLNQIVFYPDVNESNDVDLTISIWWNYHFNYAPLTLGPNILVERYTSTLNNLGSQTVQDEFIFYSSAYWTPTYEQIKYFQYADLFLLGGGGGGGSSRPAYYNDFPLSAYETGAGGGGGGEIKVVNNQSLTYGTTYTVIVGNGGGGANSNNNNTDGGDGGNSSALGYTANGGKGGRRGELSRYVGPSGGDGGNGATGGVRTGPSWAGGGGAGGYNVGQNKNGTKGLNHVWKGVTNVFSELGAGGGGGGTNEPYGNAGVGWGPNAGDGADLWYEHATSALPYTGCGGGGGGTRGPAAEDVGFIFERDPRWPDWVSFGGNGGSGIVKIWLHN